GNEEQKQEYLPPFTQGKLRLAVSFTEPESGSDTASLSTRAYLDGDEFVINGEKLFCPVAHVEDTIIQIAVKTDSEAPRGKGISLLLVENNAPGVEIRRMKTMGHFITGLNQIVLRNVRVPRSRVMGPLHEGLQAYLRHHATTARLFLAASHIGAAQTVVNDALQYAKEREQFGQPIGKFQAIGHMLADMQTDVDAARLLVYRAASYADHDLPNLKEASQAKLYSGEVYFRVANQGMQIMGGYGYMMEYDMQRYMREARPATVAAGSSQIMRNLIAQQMGL
ncbi:MAG: acyl-CoA dehydrogenase, partial [Chloroflexi bacterium]|nr:acyl-CoA dehydrogenase [Chloroflexota bacterium]